MRPRHRAIWNEVNANHVHIATLLLGINCERPLGFCVDIEAPKSVVGIKELTRAYRSLGMTVPKLEPSINHFRFADAVYESRGTSALYIATRPGVPEVEVLMDVVQADIPALLGIDVLDREGLTPDTVANCLTRRVHKVDKNGDALYEDIWCVPTFRSTSNHTYVGIRKPSNVMFTRAELFKLHKQFFHPSAAKLFHLLRRARPEEATAQTLKELESLANRCDSCQRIQNAPTRFRVSFGAENVRFNERVFIDIMYIEGKPILHLVDEGTRFSAASWLPDVSTKTIWSTILSCWASIYTSLPNRMLVDQGSVFGKFFVDMGAVSNVKVERTGIEAHSSLGLGERYHQPLRQTYRKIQIAHPLTPPALPLSLAVKAMNDTLGPEDLVPSALVFGEFPPVQTISETPQTRSNLRERSETAQTARHEMGKLMAEMRVNRALKHAVPPAAQRVHHPGDKVLVWRENQFDNRIGEWVGPFKVNAVDEGKKLVFIKDRPIGPARPSNAAQVKPCMAPDILAHSFIMELDSRLSRFRSPNDAETLVTEIIDRGDPRAHSESMTEAQKVEIKNLLKQGTFKVILKEELLVDGNILPGRFVLLIKSTKDNKVKHKARYVIGGHRDRYKNMMVHSTSTLQPQSIRLLLALAATLDFDMWTSDVHQAYLQSAEPLGRKVFIKNPATEFELASSECLQILKPLYGLCDSGDIWHATLDAHHREDLDMKPMRSDPALYASLVGGALRGLSGGYVDDLIRAGDTSFRDLCKKTNERFDMDADQSIPCTFTGFLLSKDCEGELLQDQHCYLRNLEHLPTDATFSNFRSMRMRPAWLSNTRPDCLFQISQLAQVTEDMYNLSSRTHIKRLNKVVKYACSNRIPLRFPKLDLASLRIVEFSDASFANNADFSPQLGHICFLADETDSIVPNSFKSYKSKRVTRSVMAGEVIAFSDLFDVAVTLSEELGMLLNKRVPVQLFSDSKSLYDVISKGSRTSEKRMMIDMAAARGGFKSNVISDIGFVRLSHNIADGLTREMSQAGLCSALATGKLKVTPEQWIVRN